MKGDGDDASAIKAAATVVCMMLYAAADRAIEHLRDLRIRFWSLEGETAISNDLSEACRRDALFYMQRIEAGPHTGNPAQERKTFERLACKSRNMCCAQYLRAKNMRRELNEVARAVTTHRSRVGVGTLETPPADWMQEYYKYEAEWLQRNR